MGAVTRWAIAGAILIAVMVIAVEADAQELDSYPNCNRDLILFITTGPAYIWQYEIRIPGYPKRTAQSPANILLGDGDIYRHRFYGTVNLRTGANTINRTIFDDAELRAGRYVWRNWTDQGFRKTVRWVWCDGVEQWRWLVQSHFPASEVDRALCVMWHESQGNPKAVNSNSGAAGLFQIMPFWVDGGDPLHPYWNVRTARKIWDLQGWDGWTPYRERDLCR